MDRAPFAEMNAHPLVVESLGVASTPDESEAMIERVTAELAREGWGAWAAAEVDGGGFVGMVGLHRVPDTLPCAPAVEVLWRLHPARWGHGYATEAARAALQFGFAEGGLSEIVAFANTRNARSQAVMARLGMVRDPASDFDHPMLPEGNPLRRHLFYRVTAAQLAAAS
jgi:ribosomal-protein-alanine N-acetyltransferase